MAAGGERGGGGGGGGGGGSGEGGGAGRGGGGWYTDKIESCFEMQKSIP